MEVNELIDILHELMVVDTDEGLVVSSAVEGNQITVRLVDGSSFEISVRKA